MTDKPFDVTVIGGGMITRDLLLPSLYQLQRDGWVSDIRVCALNSAPLRDLAEDREIAEAFPGHTFQPFPPRQEDPQRLFPDLYKEVLSAQKPYQAVIVAMPDHLHYPTVKEALNRNQHVLCVKPLVLHHAQAVEIEKLARDKGLFVGIEYHKRFDRRALIARREYRRGRLGEFVIGEAKMIEPYYYRHSNFQNWFTTEITDPFVYVGCHYVDLVWFITGIRPTAVSVNGVKGRFPNGNEGYLWANGRVIYENGAILNVTDGLGYPDEAAGSNEQGLTMYFEGRDQCGYLRHNDQFRGVEHHYTDGKKFQYVNPDFYKLASWEGPGYKPIGYGFDSVAGNLSVIRSLRRAVEGMGEEEALIRRRAMIQETDANGIIATPANSYINELVVEAARLSIAHDGDMVTIRYGDKAGVELRSK